MPEEVSERSGFFNYVVDAEGNPDRSYSATEFSLYFSLFVGNGVFANPVNQLRVDYKNDTSSPFSVIVRRGWAFIDGHFYQLMVDTELVLPVNTETFSITDSIVCTLDNSKRQVNLGYLTKVSNNGLPRNDGIRHDLVLATITLKPNAARIAPEDIVDRRPDTNYCGFVKGLIDEIDTSEMFSQYYDAFQAYSDDFTAKQNKYFTDKSEELEIWTEDFQQQQQDYFDQQTGELQAWILSFRGAQQDYFDEQTADLENWITEFRQTQEDYYVEQTGDLETWIEAFRAQQQEFFDEQTGSLKDWADDFTTKTENYFNAQSSVFTDWFTNIQNSLSGDVATSLQQQINEIKYYYVKDNTLYIPSTINHVDDHVLFIGTSTLQVS